MELQRAKFPLRVLLSYDSIKWRLGVAYERGIPSYPMSYWLTDPKVKPYLDHPARLVQIAPGLVAIQIQLTKGDETSWREGFNAEA
jgi:hypothetical protein